MITPVLDSRFAPGWDLGWRFTRWTVVALCPTPGHLGVFRCRADVVSGKLSAVETDEYYYADIVSVLTKGASTDGVLFAPVDHSVFGPREMPRLAGRELHLASPGTDRTLVKVAATAKKLHQRSEEDSRRTTEQLSIATYPTGVEEATAAVRSWLRATRRADSPR